jgi:2-polyprenyl-3-methyl-5-hydroxy-6-metoxy-1,4-benzoquinol methylase
MRAAPSILPYLQGEDYSDGLRIRYEIEPKDRRPRDRLDVLKELCRGRKVIHVGCVDHNIASIERKIANGTWLHEVLCKNTKRCLGVDINSTGIHYMRDRLGYQDVEVVDIGNEDSAVIAGDYWDILLLGEVLEHIDNPVQFLSQIRLRLSKHVRQIIITVPNAFNKVNTCEALQNRECINTDHRYWFTPFTLAKVAARAGIRIDLMRLCGGGLNVRSTLRHLLKLEWLAAIVGLTNKVLMRTSIIGIGAWASQDSVGSELGGAISDAP